jgi:hypothetical protein
MVESEKVGLKPKSGVVTGVNGPLVQFRWDDGRETSFVPAAGSMRVAPPTRNGEPEEPVDSAGRGSGAVRAATATMSSSSLPPPRAASR